MTPPAAARSREVLGLAALAAIGPLTALAGAWLIGLRGWFNDFHIYYLAGALVARGRSPYDPAAIDALGRSLGLDFVVGGGYSYPPPFALAMAPVSALPFGAAVGLFTTASIAAFALTVGWWLGRIVPSGPHRAVLALGAGFYPPVAGSVFAGQANLLVLGLLGIGLAPFLPRADEGVRPERSSAARSFAAGIAIGLSGIVKLAPLALAAPFALAALGLSSAAAALAGLVAGAVGALVIGIVLAPTAAAGAAGLGLLFAPDPFSTNQSLNGVVSRLFLDGDRTVAILAGEPEPFIVVATGALAGATLVVLVRVLGGRSRPTADGLAAALALAIVAAAAGAPKNSFWNHAPVLLAIALALAAGGLTATRTRRILVGVWLGATALQALLDRWLDQSNPPHSPALTLLSGSATLALLALWLALAAQSLSIRRRPVRRGADGA
ncbi:MAG TPA: glycosyltransferase family 87 protein [Candidatus Limnocylindrales bacterium]